MPTTLDIKKSAGEAMLPAPRRFEFERDTFAFANELLWEYRFDNAAGKTIFARRHPKPDYALRCFVLVRVARQFLYHARFDAGLPAADDAACRRLIREIVSRNPRQPCPPQERVAIPGFSGLREFSAAREAALKSECGGAWRSYVLRSHWRMILPVSRSHQKQTASRLAAALAQNLSPIVHLVTFPSLTMNHGMILFGMTETAGGADFSAYDPNDPAQPTRLTFDRASKTFFLPQNRYWAGGRLNVIEIFRGWFM
jgi:hypothetical protein